MKQRGIPHAETPTGRLRAWLLANPGDFLTYTDIAARYGISRERASDIVNELRRQGLVESGTAVWLNPSRVRSTGEGATA